MASQWFVMRAVVLCVLVVAVVCLAWGCRGQEADPCCVGPCTAEGKEKYYSIAPSLGGVMHCGECCIRPEAYPLFHIFEKNLTKGAAPLTPYFLPPPPPSLSRPPSSLPPFPSLFHPLPPSVSTLSTLAHPLTSTLAETEYPCAAHNYTVYWETESHGFPPVVATLDLYNMTGSASY